MQAFKVKSLKKVGAIVAAAIGITSSQTAQATAFTSVGRVNNVVAFDTGQGANANSFTLVGVSSLGNCGVVFGSVVFKLKDDTRGQQMYAAALAAAASGSTIFVTSDDTNRDNSGLCYAIGIGVVGN